MPQAKRALFSKYLGSLLVHYVCCLFWHRILLVQSWASTTSILFACSYKCLLQWDSNPGPECVCNSGMYL